jgi:hypothetical protein
MTDQHHTQSLPEPASHVPIPAQPSRSNKQLWIILGIAFSFTCLCSILCTALVATGAYRVIIERTPITTVLDTFMTYMLVKEPENAYALFSPRAQRQVSLADLEDMITGNNYVLFDGYQSLSIDHFTMSATANTNPDLPQGTTANVNGTVTYKGGFTGQLIAVLEKVDGSWRLHKIHVTVSPDKFGP